MHLGRTNGLDIKRFFALVSLRSLGSELNVSIASPENRTPYRKSSLSFLRNNSQAD